jgi:hypothetical protein
VGDIDIAVVDSLKVLDPRRPIREADMDASPIVRSLIVRSKVLASRLRSLPARAHATTQVHLVSRRSRVDENR